MRNQEALLKLVLYVAVNRAEGKGGDALHHSTLKDALEPFADKVFNWSLLDSLAACQRKRMGV